MAAAHEREKKRLRKELNGLERDIKPNVRNEFNASISKQIASFSKGAKSLWQLTKRIRDKSENNATKISINGHQTIDDTDRANHVAKIFEKSYQITINNKHEEDVGVKHTVNAFQMFSYLNCQPP